MSANQFHSEAIESRSEESDVEESDTAYDEVPRTRDSRIEMPHNSDDSDWQHCDSVVAIKKRHPRTTPEVDCQNQRCQTGESPIPQRNSVNSMNNRSHEVLKSVRHTNGLVNDHSSRPMFKKRNVLLMRRFRRIVGDKRFTLKLDQDQMLDRCEPDVL